LLALFAIGQYNSLVTLRNRYKNTFAQIDVQLKRRYDLIPNLVETAKGYLEPSARPLKPWFRPGTPRIRPAPRPPQIRAILKQ
jgi:hypothetical protein